MRGRAGSRGWRQEACCHQLSAGRSLGTGAGSSGLSHTAPPAGEAGSHRTPLPGRHLRPIQVGGVPGLLPDVGGLGPAGRGCVGSGCATSPGR